MLFVPVVFVYLSAWEQPTCVMKLNLADIKDLPGIKQPF